MTVNNTPHPQSTKSNKTFTGFTFANLKVKTVNLVKEVNATKVQSKTTKQRKKVQRVNSVCEE